MNRFGHVIRSWIVLLAALVMVAAPTASAGSLSFAPQTRVGFTIGDQWEPAIAADRLGHVYVLYPQYGGVLGCPTCFSPTMILQISADHGATWGTPTVIYPPGSTGGQYDAQIVVDPLDGQSVYAAWLQDGKSDVTVARSGDFGVTWAVAVANRIKSGADKPILAVQGQDVYVAYNHAQKIWVSASHDGGATFTSVNANKTGTGKLGWSLAGGGTVASDGNVYFGWSGYEQNGGAKGPVNLFVSRSTDEGVTWTNILVDISASPPTCSEFLCGWAYLGAQLALTSDAAGTLYALWNAGAVDKRPERTYFATSGDGGLTWSPKVDVSLAPLGSNHAFPALAAGGAGDIRISWMDDRAGGLWNAYYRSSTDGGSTWSSESDLSTYVDGYSYILPDGFRFPFGDYYEMDIDDLGATHVVWGEGLNYDSPGSIWYTTGR